MRKGIIHFVIFILLGAIINIVVAWSWILFVTTDAWHYSLGDEVRDSLPDHVFVEPHLLSFSEIWTKNRGFSSQFVYGTKLDVNGVTDYVDLYSRCEAGWPMSTFDGTKVMTPNGIEEAYLYFLVANSSPVLFKNRLLPLRPILPGFVINTIIYGGAAWLFICGPFVLRRSRRRKRKQCVACGYPIGKSDVCTECGFALKPVASNVAK